MDTQESSRLQELDHIRSVTQQLDQRINIILSKIGWNVESTIDPTTIVKAKNKAHSSMKSPPNSSKTEDNDSKIWCQSREEKLANYENARSTNMSNFDKSFDDENMCEIAGDHQNQSTSSKTMSFAEMTKLKRDLKRRRMKHRTTKAPPLSHTEELRALIDLQMEAWHQFSTDNKLQRK